MIRFGGNKNGKYNRNYQRKRIRSGRINGAFGRNGIAPRKYL